jgi:hypothetical protein
MNYVPHFNIFIHAVETLLSIAHENIIGYLTSDDDDDDDDDRSDI